MIAIVGIPGSTHHTWQRCATRAEAAAWIERTWQRVREINPALGDLPTEIVSEREAASRRWRDGTRIYRTTDDA